MKRTALLTVVFIDCTILSDGKIFEDKFHAVCLDCLVCCDLNFFFWYFSFSQGRHVKTGQLAAIKVMEVTEVKVQHISFHTHSFFSVDTFPSVPASSLGHKFEL